MPYVFEIGTAQNDIGLHLTEASPGDAMVGFLEFNDQVLCREDAARFAQALEGMAEVLSTASTTSWTVEGLCRRGAV